MEKPFALTVEHLTVNYGETPVLFDVNLQVPAGQRVAILGPNGAGKSTFLKACLGLTPALSGQVRFLGLPLKECPLKIAYMPQRESVDWAFPITVEELVLMGCYGRLGLFRWPGKEERQKALHYLDQVEMLPFAKRQISQLSQGQQQRVFLARALMQEAQVYFMDEPLSGIDLATEKKIMQLLDKLRSQGRSIFVVHHDLNTVRSYFDWVIALNMRLIESGPIQIFDGQLLKRTFGKQAALFDGLLA
ncbi:MAG: transporter ATP-binding protein ytgB [Chlamydiales bacterium]|jgi:manganese/zinc/iron transport system ATP- binding protein|nr:transporter ATP-binding protein ytgB [Chlamydiales bacterium]